MNVPASILPQNLNFLKPKVSDLIRIGGFTDGGYLVPKQAIEPVEILISIGISDDWSFETDIYSRKKMEIKGYDRTSGSLFFLYFSAVAFKKMFTKRNVLRQFKIGIKFLGKSIAFLIFWRRERRFFRKWIVEVQSNEKEIAIATIFQNINLSTNLAIKIDIEGNEYGISEVLLTEIKKRKGSIQFLIIEFHNTIERRNEFVKLTSLLCDSLSIAHIHGNNFGRMAEDGFPEVVEITFCDNSFVGTESVLNLPNTELDVPSNPLKKDVGLRFS